MRLLLFRRGRGAFSRPTSRVTDVMGVATREAGAAGIDSLDLLVATLVTPKAVRLVTDVGGDPRAIQVAARSARTSRDPAPGLTNDAKAVIEAMSRRAALARANPDIEDVLVALAAADCLAQGVLKASGITAATLAARVGGPLPE